MLRLMLNNSDYYYYYYYVVSGNKVLQRVGTVGSSGGGKVIGLPR